MDGVAECLASAGYPGDIPHLKWTQRFQMSRHVPDTLTLDRIHDDAVDQVLIQNGLQLRFYLPHAMECAQLASPRRDVLERALEKPLVRKLAYTAG